MDTGVGSVRSARVVPFDDQLVELPGGQDWEFRQAALLGSSRNRAEQNLQTRPHTEDGGVVKQVGAVFDDHPEPIAALAHFQNEIQ
ncbi:MAG TPA: hypothetical protein VHK68_08555, partial [Gemmatimonadales bacterium]|nr:hypothetical protein [Gemmatimonadales bacterium]